MLSLEGIHGLGLGCKLLGHCLLNPLLIPSSESSISIANCRATVCLISCYPLLISSSESSISTLPTQTRAPTTSSAGSSSLSSSAAQTCLKGATLENPTFRCKWWSFLSSVTWLVRWFQTPSYSNWSIRQAPHPEKCSIYERSIRFCQMVSSIRSSALNLRP